MLGLLGAGISALGSLFGSKQSADATAAANAANVAEQDKINSENIAMQKEFAQNGIQWKTADARAAGINPITALGASTSSFSNLVGSTVSPDPNAGHGVAQAGQDIGRAVAASSSVDDKYNEAVKSLTLQKGELENQLLASQIAKNNQAAPTPPMPTANQRWLVDGQGQTAIPSRAIPLVTTNPMKRTASDPSNPVIEPGAVSDVGFSRTKDGYAPVPSSDVMGKMSNDMPGIIMWNLRNRVLPSIGLNQTPPGVSVPAGYDYWNYDPLTQSYRPDRNVFKHPGDFFGDYFKERR